MQKPEDVGAGRKGQWMQTSLGGKFWPQEPRASEVFVSDIANGLAMDCRYGGQVRIDRFYSVAEHCVHIAEFTRRLGWPAKASLAALFHDAPEAYINDLPRSVKQAVGPAYKALEHELETVIMCRLGLQFVYEKYEDKIKHLDCRIVPLEKEAIMRYPQPWAYDEFVPLEGVKIQCWSPPRAKIEFLKTYRELCEEAGIEPEETEL